MQKGFTNIIKELANVDLFEQDKDTQMPKTGVFVGNPFYIDYDKARLLVADAWKMKAGGLPQGSFLLAYYANNIDAKESAVREAILLRVLGPTSLPTDSEVVSSMVEFYKEGLSSEGRKVNVDEFTRYEFSFSGVECRVLGTFYADQKTETCFGADVENFMSAHHYKVIKPNAEILKKIVNFRKGEITGTATDIELGTVRYSSSKRHQEIAPAIPVFVTPKDFLGKRTAMFGMTRTGKSNTVKIIIEAVESMSALAVHKALPKKRVTDTAPTEAQLAEVEPFEGSTPKFPVGQIIFDVNGEYANPNLQDKGTAIFEIYAEKTLRYSVISKPGFRVMKVNFYQDIDSGFELIRSYLAEATGDYLKSFLAVDLTTPENYGEEQNNSEDTRHDRRIAAYLCVLKKAGFKPPQGFKVKFRGNEVLNTMAGGLDPAKGLTLDEAVIWWTTIWDNYTLDKYFADYQKKNRKEWADEDLKAILVMLTKKKTPTAPKVSGFAKLDAIKEQHTEQQGDPFDLDIIKHLRAGGIVIADLSQGDPSLQRMFSERICRKIFQDAMARFVTNEPNNFIQFYFEEAHNLFPKKDDKDLAQIYNRLAKEGAKLNLGMTYATQEVSSISSNILKNTQNWFIAHLNNEDETRELRKYYDFGDFTEGLVRFSASSDQGFVRMKTYSNPFVVPVQVKLFGKKAEVPSATNGAAETTVTVDALTPVA
jgi:DNA helicase HerA-like ATPase